MKRAFISVASLAAALAGQSLHSEDITVPLSFPIPSSIDGKEVRKARPLYVTKNFLDLFTVDVPNNWQVLKTDAAFQSEREHIIFLAILPHKRSEEENKRMVWLYANARVKVSIYEPHLLGDENDWDESAMANLARSLESAYREDVRRESGLRVKAKKDVIDDISVISIKTSSEKYITETEEEICFVTANKEFHVVLTYVKVEVEETEQMVNRIRQSIRLTKRY